MQTAEQTAPLSTDGAPEEHVVQEYVIPAVVPRRKPFYSAVKRLFDLTMALLGLVVLCIPMAIIAIVIRLDSPGDVIFRQVRLGKDARPFTMYKFRSMRMDAEKNGAQWTDADDDRCTRVGRFLRRCRMDELPQLWNILRGDMSIVGPRPERPVFYEEFETYIHGFSHRLAVRPGLTGYAQVNGGYDLKPEEKIQFDMQYIAQRSIWMDLKCICKTVRIVFTHEGAK